MKKILLTILAVSFTSLCLTSCGSFANMSDKDAYDMGYGIGLGIRQLLDN